MKITSTQNLKIKNLVKLKKASQRKKQGLILVEGEDEIKLALKSKFELEEIFYCPDFGEKDIKKFKEKVIEVNKEVFKRVSYREHPESLLAVFKTRQLKLEKIKLSKNPLLVVLEGIEKPGNLGAILRTADVVGVDLLIVNDSKVDVYNPNVIRASRGAIFTTQLVSADLDDTISYLKKNKIQMFATALSAKKDYTKVNLKKASAIILGTEADGLSKKWLDSADELIKIPMKGDMDSLNVSVSTAIMLFEALKQRGK